MQPRRHRRRKRRQICAHIGQRIGAQRGEIVVCVQCQFDLRYVIAAMGIRHKRFGPRRGPFHRTIASFGGKCAEGFFGIMEDLGAKSPSHIRRNHTHFMFGQTQHKGTHQQPDHMGILAGGIKRVILGAALIGAHSDTRLHRVGDKALIGQIQGCNMSGTVKSRLDRCFIRLSQNPVITQV